MITETASPVESAPAPEAGSQQPADLLAPEQESQQEGEQTEQAKADDEGNTKPEKTPEERERARMQRGIDRRTRQLAETKAEAAQLRQQLEALTKRAPTGDNQAPQDDSEPLTLTRAQIQQMVTAEAAKLAPTLKDQATEVERRQGVIQSLAKTWGQERFDELSSDLDDAFGGLTDSRGQPKPAIEAVFEADDPAKVIEFLADPENSDEAERIARLSPIQAGKAIAMLETKLKTAKAKDKPQPSKVPAPLEAVKAQGGASAAPDPSNTKAWIAWRNAEERRSR